MLESDVRTVENGGVSYCFIDARRSTNSKSEPPMRKNNVILPESRQILTDPLAQRLQKGAAIQIL